MDWQALLGLWPFTPSESIHILLELGVAVFAAFSLKDWGKLKDVIESKALEIAEETLSKEDKRNAVIDYAYNLVPLKLKMWVNKSTIGYLVDWVYQNRVQPRIKREQENKVSDKLNDSNLIDAVNDLVKDTE